MLGAVVGLAAGLGAGMAFLPLLAVPEPTWRVVAGGCRSGDRFGMAPPVGSTVRDGDLIDGGADLWRLGRPAAPGNGLFLYGGRGQRKMVVVWAGWHGWPGDLGSSRSGDVVGACAVCVLAHAGGELTQPLVTRGVVFVGQCEFVPSLPCF